MKSMHTHTHPKRVTVLKKATDSLLEILFVGLKLVNYFRFCGMYCGEYKPSKNLINCLCKHWDISPGIFNNLSEPMFQSIHALVHCVQDKAKVSN